MGKSNGKSFEQSVLGMASGQSLPDPSLPGLEYRRRAGGVFVRYRYKDPRTGRWTAVSLGKLAEGAKPDERGIWRLEPSAKPFISLRQEALAKAEALSKGSDPRTGAGPDGLPMPRALAAYEADLARRGAAKGREVLSLLRRELLPLGLPIGAITRQDVLKRVADVEKSGRPGAAKELRDQGERVFELGRQTKG